MQELLTVVATGIISIVGTLGVQWMRGRTDGKQQALTLHEHSDQLMFDVLGAAREEIKVARTEAMKLRPLVAHLDHFDEALGHIESLVNSQTEDQLMIAREAARQFLVRIKNIRSKA